MEQFVLVENIFTNGMNAGYSEINRKGKKSTIRVSFYWSVYDGDWTFKYVYDNRLSLEERIQLEDWFISKC